MRRAVALVVVLALVLTGIGAVALVALDDGAAGPGSAPPVTTPEPGATEPPRPALAAYYSQRLAWTPCGDGDWCATLTVPLDYRHPRGDTIDLAVLEVPAADPERRLGSLVVNPGGPGVPGTDYAAHAVLAFRPSLRDVFDIVGFDPRGVGRSDPVDCLDDDALDAYVAMDPAPDTPEEVAAVERSTAELGRGCRQRSGALADHVSTVEAARDMDVLRAALGESTLTYLGASYGTKLGATYADLFPDRAGRLVLDGAVDPTLDARQLAVGQAGGFELALRSYVGACVDAGDCFLGDGVEAGLGTIQELVRSVDADPLRTSLDDRELRVGNAFTGIVRALYSRDLWRILDQGLRRALDGDGTVLLQLSDSYASRRPGGGYADNSLEANAAINCLDDPSRVRPDDVPLVLPELEQASPTFGEVFAWGLTSCDGFPPQRAAARDPDPRAAGAPPIVVVGTTRDPATPYAWAVALARQLESGVLVTRDGDGHTGYNEGNACVDEAVEAYLVQGIVPRDGLRC
jgi:pimeloyl-ACP methyl ester carboxylesterase